MTCHLEILVPINVDFNLKSTFWMKLVDFLWEIKNTLDSTSRCQLRHIQLTLQLFDHSVLASLLYAPCESSLIRHHSLLDVILLLGTHTTYENNLIQHSPILLVESKWQLPVIAYYSVVTRLQTMREIASLISFFGRWLVLAGWMQWNFYTHSPLRHFFRLDYCEYAQDN